MCGIVGVGRLMGGGLFDAGVRTFHDMLIAGMVRGMDGTGIVRVKKNHRVELRKIKGNTIDLLRADGVVTWLRRASTDCDQVLFGHNRYATTTNKSNSDAHPFQSGHITLVHNGTLSNPDDLVKGEKFDVDSAALTNAIAKLGVKEALLKAQGAISIVFYDRKEKTLNFYRNSARPMFIHYGQYTKELVFASEKKMVEWAADRNANTTVMPLELPTYMLTQFSLVTGEKLEPIRIDPWEHNRAVSTNINDYWGKQTDGSCNVGGAVCETDEFLDEFDGRAGNLALPGPKGVGVVEASNEPEPVTLPDTTIQTRPPFAHNITNMNKIMHVDELFGYKKDSIIQWVACDVKKSGTSQDQWKIAGCVIDAKEDGSMAKLEVQCFVKGEETAKRYDAAHVITSKVRSMQKMRFETVSAGPSIIFVSDSDLQIDDDIVVAAPDNAPVQVETKPVGKIVDMKGSTYDPNVVPTLTDVVPATPEAEKKPLLHLAAVGFLGDSTGSRKLH